jgi:hypothetical protein
MRATIQARLLQLPPLPAALIILSMLILGGSNPTRAAAAADPAPRLCFLQALPQDRRAAIADDVKLLVGWTFDAFAAGYRYQDGAIIDRTSGFIDVPGFAAPTPMQALGERYRLVRPPFDRGRGYYGLLFAALDAENRPVALILANRLFRMPVLLQQPAGAATDLLTNAALALGFETDGVTDAVAAAETSYEEAAKRGVPLILAGQSQAGATAQLQAATLQKSHADGSVPTGFLTMNAAEALLSVRDLGLDADTVEGVNFSKDYDPGVGPHALFANAVGRQIYIHPDGTGGTTPGNYTIFDAMLHPKEHFLESFNAVPLAAALEPVLAAMPHCAHPKTTNRA